MRHRAGPRDLAAALDRIVARTEPQTPLARLQRVWPQVVGEHVAAHATPTAVSVDGVVIVTCDSAVWAQEMDLLAVDVLAGIDAALGAGTVRRLHCQGIDAAPWARAHRPRGRNA